MTSEETIQATKSAATTDAGKSATESTDSETLSWSYTVATSRFLRGLAALSMGVVGGMALAVLVGAVVFSAGLILSGQYAIAAAILLALAVMALRIAPQQLALRRGQLSESNLLSQATRKLGWKGLLAASLFGIGVFWVGLQLGGVGFFAVVFGTIAAPMLAVSILTSEGELDAESNILTYCGTDVDLSALDGFRRVSLGKLALYRFSYVSGAMSYRTPRLLVVPASADDQIRQAIESGVASESEEYDSPNRAIQATMVAFGLGLLAFAGLLLTVEPTSANPRGGVVLVYAALCAGVFGLIFLSLAARS